METRNKTGALASVQWNARGVVPIPWVVVGLAVVMLLGLFLGLTVAAAEDDVTRVLALGSIPHAIQWILLLLASVGLAGTWALGLHHLAGAMSARRREQLLLQRSYRDLEAFAATAAHDLRAPLRGIHLHADLGIQAMDRADRSKARQQMSLVRQRSEQMSAMIDELLRCSRVDAPGRERSMALPRLVEEAVDLAGLPPTLQVRWAVPNINIAGQDATRLRHVLQNIVANSAQHHDREHGRVDMEFRTEGDSLHITVDDDGPGLPQGKRLPTQGSSNSSRPSGIGLSIVRRLTREQGGTASFVAKEGRGARLAVRWPLQPMPPVRTAQTTS